MATYLWASEPVSELVTAFFISNGYTLVWGMELKWKFL
jgi:hypothetical protein